MDEPQEQTPGGESAERYRVGLQPASLEVLTVVAMDVCQRRAKALWTVAAARYLPLLVAAVLALQALRADLDRTVGVVLAYLLLNGAATFLAQVQLARYVAKDWLGQPPEGDCGTWWSRHLPGVVQSAGATFVGLCGVYGAIYVIATVLMFLIGSDNEPALMLLFTLVAYLVWFCDLAYRAMATFVPTVTGFGLAAGWDALGRSFRLARAALLRKSEIVPLTLGIELVITRAAMVLSNVFEGHEPVAFVLAHGLLSLAVRPVLTVVQSLYLIDALGREQSHDEASLTATLGGAVGGA